MTAEDVRGVFAKAFELGDWGYEKTVPLEEVGWGHVYNETHSRVFLRSHKMSYDQPTHT